MTDKTEILTEIEDKLKTFAAEARELYLDEEIPVLNRPPSPLVFYRHYVASNNPVIIKNSLKHWPALQKWNSAYFRKKIGDLSVSVAVTPNGYADAITDGRFVMPEEKQMKMSRFLDIIQSPEDYNGVYYIQKQNSNLTEEFSAIIDDVEPEISWGSEAFGKSPDAVNFWMGDERAITSTHRDHYENLYCVVKGWKKFILLPPTDLPFVPYEKYQAAVFKENAKGGFDIIDDIETGEVPWVSVDPLNPNLERYPQYCNARPVTVTVHAGEILYLPSLWFHHVQQSHGCIAVNYWYDMEFDIKYNYSKLLESLVNLRR